MYIGTIHGWCLKALQEHEYQYQSFSVLDEIKLKLFVDKHYDSIGMKDIVKLSNPAVPLRRFIDTSLFVRIMDILRESDKANEDAIPAHFYEAKEKYETTLKSKRLFDFSMIMEEAMRSLERDTNLVESIRNNLKYLIVDEYQDVNPIQDRLIKKLQSISNCKLVVVGDDDQNIYQWRGSNNKYIIEFPNQFNQDEVASIPLSKNYRSSAGITAIAETLISNNKNRIPDKRMESAGEQGFEKGIDVLYNRFESVEEENEAIANYIDSIIGLPFSEKAGDDPRGLAFSDVCILLRTWNKAESVAKALEAHKIPYITAGVNQLFQMVEVEAALGIFKFLYNDINREELLELWLKLPNITISTGLLNHAIDKLEKMFPTLPEVDKAWDYSLQGIFWDFLSDAEIYEEAFTDTSSSDAELRSKERAEIMFFNFGKFSQVINDFEEVNFNSTSPKYHLFSFLSFVTYVARDYYPEGWLNNPYKTPNAVQIMTIHQSKGLEFPVVIIPGLNNNYLPSKRRGGLNEWHFLDRNLIKEQSRYEGEPGKEDERRLFYVAITRSQKYLLLTQAPDLDNKLYKTESDYIKELHKAKVGSFPVLISDPKISFEHVPKLDQQPREKVKNITLDFTSLKDIFECPYRFKLISVFGFRYPLDQRMGVGRSFHNCLMEIHKRAKKGEMLSESELENIIDRQTHFPYLTKSTRLPLKKKVAENVEGYYEDNKDEFSNIEFVEQDIQYKINENILVLGRIDLIKKISENGNYETTIIEFKSDEENADSLITKDQLKLYALGHRELTGEVANYIMTYVIGENRSKTPERLRESDLNYIEDKITQAVELIRTESFDKTTTVTTCSNCFQARLCQHRITFNVKAKR